MLSRFYTWVLAIDWSDMRRREYDYDRYLDTFILAVRKGWI